MNLNGPLLFAMVCLVVVGSAMGCQGKTQLIQPGQRYENPKIGYEFEETADRVRITLTNQRQTELDTRLIGFYQIDNGTISPVSDLEIDRDVLEPHASIPMSFAKTLL